MTPEAELAFVAAEPREFDGFLRRVKNVRHVTMPYHWVRRGAWKGSPVLLIANGAGPVRAQAAARACGGAAAIINIGFCGALDRGLKVGDVIAADQVFFRNQVFDCRGIATSRVVPRGAVYSSPRIAATAFEKEQLRRSGAIVAEMEAGGIAEFALSNGIAFYCVRAVSDLATESFANDFNAALGADGRYRIGRLLGRALLKPLERLPELMRLKERCERASEELGEFLDSCSF
jgi:adenosylhomocysteine nucleosidase